MIGKLDQTLLTPAFSKELMAKGKAINEAYKTLDAEKWDIAQMVNAEWRDEGYEAEGVPKMEFYADCAKSLPRRIFGKSGETLRRWCDIQHHFDKVPDVELLLEATSFEHFRLARKLQKDGMCASVYAIAKAIEEKLSADEMVLWFDKSEPIEDRRGWLLDVLYKWMDKQKIPPEAAELLRQAAKIIKESMKEG